jgi:hypothetical protein
MSKPENADKPRILLLSAYWRLIDDLIRRPAVPV